MENEDLPAHYRDNCSNDKVCTPNLTHGCKAIYSVHVAKYRYCHCFLSFLIEWQYTVLWTLSNCCIKQAHITGCLKGNICYSLNFWSISVPSKYLSSIDIFVSLFSTTKLSILTCYQLNKISKRPSASVPASV